MEYVSQAVLMILALLGAFFKCVKEDADGKRLYTRAGLPRPTSVGVGIAVLLVVSYAISTVATSQSNRARATADLDRKALKEALGDIVVKLDGVRKEIRLEKGLPPVFEGPVAVRNAYQGEISLWLDGNRTDLQPGDSVLLTAKGGGSTLQLYSCGWSDDQTTAGLAAGCRFISYAVQPGEEWGIEEVQPAPRIVMRQIK